MIALIVRLEVRPERLEQFLAAIQENAERSFSDEPGCRYFDVTQDVAHPTHFVFYELYDDQAAIDAHRRAPHFAKWREAADACVVPGSQVNTFCHQRFHHA
jgi:quinol monooxygenase YgiN